MASNALVVQYVIVTLVVALSACVVMHKQSPALSRRVRVRIAAPLVAPERSPWLRTLGRWIAPPSLQASACGGCDGCGPAK